MQSFSSRPDIRLDLHLVIEGIALSPLHQNMRINFIQKVHWDQLLRAFELCIVVYCDEMVIIFEIDHDLNNDD